MPISCATCQSENVQKLSLVYQNGLSDLSGTQTAVGIGIGRGGLGVGSGRSKIKGTQQSSLSQKASPPFKKRVIRNAFIHLAITFLVVPMIMVSLFNNTAASISVVIYAVFAICHTIKSIKFNLSEYPSLYNTWNQQFMCLTCGVLFAPENNLVSEQA